MAKKSNDHTLNQEAVNFVTNSKAFFLLSTFIHLFNKNEYIGIIAIDGDNTCVVIFIKKIYNCLSKNETLLLVTKSTAS